jgi:hypothetical protein
MIKTGKTLTALPGIPKLDLRDGLMESRPEKSRSPYYAERPMPGEYRPERAPPWLDRLKVPFDSRRTRSKRKLHWPQPCRTANPTGISMESPHDISIDAIRENVALYETGNISIEAFDIRQSAA